MRIDNRLVRLYVTCIAIYFANLSKSGAKVTRTEGKDTNKRVKCKINHNLFSFSSESVFSQNEKINTFFEYSKFSGKKHLRAGECQGAKKNEEKDTKKTEAAIDDFRFLFYSIKKSKDLFA